MEFSIEDAAVIAHEVNRRYCQLIGDDSQVPWEEAPEWQRRSAIDGMKGNAKTPEESHEQWLEEKRANGWTYGRAKDEVAKTHPCMVPYDELPIEQRVKDSLFLAVKWLVAER